MDLKIDASDFERLAVGLRGFSDRRFRAAVATALTRTAREVEREWGRQLETDLDRPTPLTRRATRVEIARADRLEAVIALKDSVGERAASPAEYLGPQERGGDRNLKKFERALIAQGSMPPGHRVVPGKHAKLDQFGNISRGQLVQVIAQLGRDFSPGYQRVISKRAEKRMASAKRTGREYVAIVRRIGRLKPGVYQRSPRAAAAGGTNLLPVFWFVTRTQYERRLRLVEGGGAVARERAQAHMSAAVDEQWKRLMDRNAGVR